MNQKDNNNIHRGFFSTVFNLKIAASVSDLEELVGWEA